MMGDEFKDGVASQELANASQRLMIDAWKGLNGLVPGYIGARCPDVICSRCRLSDEKTTWAGVGRRKCATRNRARAAAEYAQHLRVDLD